MNRSGMLTIALILLLYPVSALHAREGRDVSRIVVLPLEVSQEGQYSYLRSSVRQMLISRLASRENVEIVDYQAAGKTPDGIRAALAAGKPGEALDGIEYDWLADGRLYSMKDGMQVNITFYPAAQGKTELITIKAADPEGIMPAVSRAVEEIAGKTFAQESPEAETASAPESPTGMEGFQTPHPERDYKKGLYSGTGVFGEGGDDRFESRGIRKSSNLPIVIEAMALGDLNGDGGNELVVASRSKIRVFRFAERRFEEVAGYDFSPYVKIHSVNIADIDGNGENRLFVSANEGKYPASAIMSWDGSENLQIGLANLRWYIRPVSTLDGRMVLAGQKDSPNISDRFLAPGVFELNIDAKTSGIQRGAKLLLPPKVNLFDFVIADLNGDRSPETIVIDERQKLLVYDEVLNLVWVSSANYGGSNKFFGPSPSSDDNLDFRAYSENEGGKRLLVYIPGRMDVKDITGDGLPEVVVSSNEVNTISEYMPNMRGYDGGSVACLSWRGAGLMELWRTNHIQGYVADYYFDGDGEPAGEDGERFMNRLFVAQIPDAGFWDRLLPGGKESRILAYEMQVKKEEKESN